MSESKFAEAEAVAAPGRLIPKDVLVLVGEVFSAIAALGFLASVAINALVFDRWGLSFLQVATTSDVIGSGIQLLVPATALSLGVCAGLLAAQFSPPRLWLVALLLDLALFTWAVGTVFSDRSTDIPPPLLFGFGLGSALFVGLMKQSSPVAPWPVPRNEPGWIARSRKKPGASLTIVPLVLVSAILWGVVSESVVLTIRDGYSPTVQTLSGPPVEPGCIGRVLWLGERGAVLRCGASPTASVRVVRLEDTAVIAIGHRIIRRPVGVACSVQLTAECPPESLKLLIDKLRTNWSRR